MHIANKLLISIVFLFAIEQAQASHGKGHSSGYKYVSQKKKTDKAVAEYKTEIQNAFSVIRKKIAKVWGGETVVPDANTDVTYRDNLRQRSIVDYEHGVVRVELALVSRNATNQEFVDKQLAAAIEQTILQTSDQRSIIEISQTPEVQTPNKGDPVLKGLVAKADGTPLTQKDFDQFTFAKIKVITRRALVGADGRKRVVISTKFDLVPDHIRVRAEKYRIAVDRNARIHNIPSPLIYAIMETESFFNPMAKSPIPAFGLMQLVPASGARDAYRFLNARDIVVKDTYLYNSNNNIELGVAYLHILYFQYLKKIKDPTAKQWAMIAAYNTGVNNVIRTFVGRYKKSKHKSRWIWRRQAMKKINKMAAEQVYNHLLKNLPAEETRLYIKKVRARMGKYRTTQAEKKIEVKSMWVSLE